MRFFSIAIAALVLAVAAPQLARAASSQGCNGFDGTWYTYWPGGTTTVRISGTHGTYDYLDGTLKGTVDGNAYFGSYRESNGDTGTFKFVLGDDGNWFTGWFATSANPDAHQAWRGKCTGS